MKKSKLLIVGLLCLQLAVVYGVFAQTNTAPDGFVRINGGTFTMGSPTNERSRNDDEVQHQVTVSSFFMGKYEVTQKEYQEVMGTNPSLFKGENLPVEKVSWYDTLVFCNKLSLLKGLTPAYSINGKTNPAEWGTVPENSDRNEWNDVTVIANSNGYRLPTEAQWEYACRAGTTTAYNTGDTYSDNTGWSRTNSDSTTHEVGKKPPNAWGLYDMHGNVEEWCWDWYGTYSNETQTDPTGASHPGRRGIYNRMRRGGSWYYSSSQTRSARRGRHSPGANGPDFGFRLVLP